jgi:hypothetical protein
MASSVVRAMVLGYTLKHNQLLAQHGIFRDRFKLAARKVCKYNEHEIGLGRI